MNGENVKLTNNIGYSIPVPDVMLTNKCNLNCRYCFEHKGDQSIQFEPLLKYFNEKLCYSPFIFGGEPLIKINDIVKIVDSLDFTGMNADRINKYVDGFRTIITNGTLIGENLEALKKIKAKLQVSIDGPEMVTNLNRVNYKGEGAFTKILQGIKDAINAGLEGISVHGAINKDSIKYIYDSFLFFYETTLMINKGNIDLTIQNLGQNTFQIIFEQDYTDKNIDELVENFFKIAAWIYSNKDFTDTQKLKLFHSWFEKRGGICGVGNSLKAIDYKFDIYPCHRLCTDPNRDQYLLGNVYKPLEFQHYQLYNSFYKCGMKNKFLYNTIQHRLNDLSAWVNWCPATNIQTSDGNLYYINSKYAVMMDELDKAIEIIWKYYYPKEEHNTNGLKRICNN